MVKKVSSKTQPRFPWATTLKNYTSNKNVQICLIWRNICDAKTLQGTRFPQLDRKHVKHTRPIMGNRGALYFCWKSIVPTKPIWSMETKNRTKPDQTRRETSNKLRNMNYYRYRWDIYPILGGTLALKFDSAVASAQFPLPALLRRNDTNALFFPAGKDTPRLPPLVVRRVRYVQNIAVAKVESPWR